MRDPERLSSGYGVTDFERGLLYAARNEPLPDDLRVAMERGLGLAIGGAGVVGASVLAGAKWGGLKASMLLWASACVVALGFAGGILGARLFGRGAPETADVRKVVAHVVPVVSAPPLVPPAPSPAMTARAPTSFGARPATMRDARRRAERAPTRHDSSIASDDLRVEIRLIDAAREELRVDAPVRALEILHRYAGRFPRGAFGPEAVALRVEALMKAGQTSEGEALARRFVAADPTSPLVDRVKWLASIR